MRVAVIAGTGVVSPMTVDACTRVETPYGQAFVAEHQFGARVVALLARHGPGLNVPPHMINYKANIWALRELGVKQVIATAAVGSLRQDLPPGALAAPTDFLDFTKQRDGTFFDDPGSAVVHTDFTIPYCRQIGEAMRHAARDAGLGNAVDVTYACMEGPRYETPAEIRMLATLGADVVGMTGVPEVVLARELGICYACLAIVTNQAAGISPTLLSHEDVLARMEEQGAKVHDIIGRTIELLHGDAECPQCRGRDQ